MATLIADTDPHTVLREWANSQIGPWYEAMEAADYQRAAELSISAISAHIERGPQSNAPDVFQHHFSLRIIFNGLRDLANLRAVIARDSWWECPKAVEAAWDYALSAKERICRIENLEAEFSSYCAKPVDEAFQVIAAHYGKGWYLSWELLMDSIVCNLCGEDARACEHIAGEWYDGKQCKWGAGDGRIAQIALVDNPRDLRCRIWPWNKEKNQDGLSTRFKGSIPISFLPEGDESGGSAVDVAELFASPALQPQL